MRVSANSRLGISLAQFRDRYTINFPHSFRAFVRGLLRVPLSMPSNWTPIPAQFRSLPVR